MRPEKKFIRHTVVFQLKHESGSAKEKAFLDAAKKLANIPGVEKFECLKQISKKNKSCSKYNSTRKNMKTKKLKTS